MRTAPALDHAALCALIPHAGSMCLLDAVLTWNADRIRCLIASHSAPAHPLRRVDGALGASHLLEYGAQAAAVHGGLLAEAAGERPRPGYLVATRHLTLHVARLDDLSGVLEVTAQRLLGGDSGWVYEFAITHAARRLAEGQFTIARGEAGDAGTTS